MVAPAAGAAPQPQGDHTRKYAALDLARRGAHIIPLCWPDERGKCACGRGHQGRNVGKAPLTKNGFKDSADAVKTIFEWWDKWPLANIGIDLEKSGLTCIAPDSPHWHEEFLRRGLPHTVIAQSGGGEGHLHYFYRRPEGCPITKINKTDAYDLMTQGYMVAAGSLHQSGHTYQWVSDYEWRDVEDLPFPPEWAMAELQAVMGARAKGPEVDVDFSNAPPRIDLIGRSVRPVYLDDGRIDRSKTILIAGLKLGRQGATKEEIVASLRELDESQGLRKYSRRRDGGLKAYAAIAQKATAPKPDTGTPHRTPNPEGTSKLWAVKRGSPPEDQQGKAPTSDNCHHYQGYVDECWLIHRQRRAAAIRRGGPDRLTGEVMRHLAYLAANTRTADADLSRSDFCNPPALKLCISVEDPQYVTPDLEPLAVAQFGQHDSEGNENPIVKRIRQCGRQCKWVCDEHGEKGRSFVQCGLHYCAQCLTDIARKLDRARLPDLDPESGAAYRSVWLLGRYPLPADLSAWEDSLKTRQEAWASTLVKIQRRKATKDSVLWRSFTAYYAEDEALIHWKVMFKEGGPGAADKAVASLCQVMGATVYDDRRFVHGELTSLQLVENARSHLLGFTKGMAWDTKLTLFSAHYAATKGQHVFQPLGELRMLIQALTPPEPPKCDECGMKLRQVLINENDPGPGEHSSSSNPVHAHSPPDRPAAEAATAGAYWEVQI
jgi:hypothetical protein